jgi:hypothetical protein
LGFFILLRLLYQGYQEKKPSFATTVQGVYCILYGSVVGIITYFINYIGPPLWSSGQSFWLQIQRPGFNSRHYQDKKVVGLERGALSLVSTTEELLDRKVAAPV